MIKLFRNTIWVIFLVLAVINIFIFIKGIKLSTEISFYENETNKLHQDNLELEKQAYGFDSLRYAASMAAVLNFTKKAQPIYIENAKYALK